MLKKLFKKNFIGQEKQKNDKTKVKKVEVSINQDASLLSEIIRKNPNPELIQEFFALGKSEGESYPSEQFEELFDCLIADLRGENKSIADAISPYRNRFILEKDFSVLYRDDVIMVAFKQQSKQTAMELRKVLGNYEKMKEHQKKLHQKVTFMMVFEDLRTRLMEEGLTHLVNTLEETHHSFINGDWEMVAKAFETKSIPNPLKKERMPSSGFVADLEAEAKTILSLLGSPLLTKHVRDAHFLQYELSFVELFQTILRVAFEVNREIAVRIAKSGVMELIPVIGSKAFELLETQTEFKSIYDARIEAEVKAEAERKRLEEEQRRLEEEKAKAEAASKWQQDLQVLIAKIGIEQVQAIFNKTVNQDISEETSEETELTSIVGELEDEFAPPTIEELEEEIPDEKEEEKEISAEYEEEITNEKEEEEVDPLAEVFAKFGEAEKNEEQENIA